MSYLVGPPGRPACPLDPAVYGLVERERKEEDEEEDTTEEKIVASGYSPQIGVADAGVEKEQEMMASASQKEPNSFSALQVVEIVMHIQGVLGKSYVTDAHWGHVKWVVAQIESDDNLATTDAKLKVEMEVMTKVIQLGRDFLDNPPPQLEPGAAALLARWKEEEDHMRRVHLAAELLDAYVTESAHKADGAHKRALLQEAVLQGHLKPDEVEEAFSLHNEGRECRILVLPQVASMKTEPKKDRTRRTGQNSKTEPKKDHENFAGLSGASKYIVGPVLLLIGLALSIALGVVWLVLYPPMSLLPLTCYDSYYTCTDGRELTDIVYHYVVKAPWNFAYFICTGDRSVFCHKFERIYNYGTASQWGGIEMTRTGGFRDHADRQLELCKQDRINEQADRRSQEQLQNEKRDLERRMAFDSHICS